MYTVILIRVYPHTCMQPQKYPQKDLEKGICNNERPTIPPEVIRIKNMYITKDTKLQNTQSRNSQVLKGRFYHDKF